MPKKTPKKRGRPPKRKQRATAAAPSSSNPAVTAKRGCGRPRKQPVQHGDGWDPSTPFVREVHLRPRPPQFKGIKVPVHGPKFVFPKPETDFDNVKEVVMRLSQLYLPDTLIQTITRCTLEYIDARKVRASKRFKLCTTDMFHFFTIVYDMGYCRLPCLKDYWRVGLPCLKDYWLAGRR